MKKIFRMARAELGKIFMRPSMIILATILIVTLVLSFFFFTPTQTKTKLTYADQPIYKIQSEFEKKADELDAELILIKTDIDKYLSEENNTYTALLHETQILCDAYDAFYRLVFDNYKAEKLSIAKKAYSDFREVVLNYKNNVLAAKVDGQYVNFFMTISEYKKIEKTITNLLETLPSNDELEDFDSQLAIDILEVVKSSFEEDLNDLENVIFNKITPIEIDDKDLKKLLDLYYTPNVVELTDGYERAGTLKKLYDEIYSFYTENLESANKDDVAIMNEKIAHYYDYVEMCKTLISNNFELLRIGTKTDEQIVTYNGFSGVSIYNLKLEITTSKYFYDLNNDEDEDNDSFGYEYLDVFNFNVNSGTATNAYDFTFFAMQILSSLIILFVIFFAGSAITGEQNSGTLKMTAIRPYSRNKIFSGKFLACFNVSLILLIVSFVASFVVGFASFGLPTQNVLVVMNASEIFILHPILVMLIYLASLIIDILFYILLSILISMLIKPTTINTAVSASVFIISTILSGCITDSWIRFIPTTHLGLFKFFTNSNTAMFSYSIVPGVNFLVSGGIVLVCIIMFDLIGRMLFTRKSIDK